MGKQQNETIIYRKYLREYNKLAKKADRRMRELERFSRYDEYADIKKFAYKKAAEMIKTWTPPDKMYEDRAPRWQRNIPFDTRSLKAKIKDIESFLEMKSSKITGIKEIYKNRTAALNEKYQTNFTWQQLAHFFEDGGLADKAFDKYGSATVLLAYGKIQKNKDKALEIIQKFNEDHKQISEKDKEKYKIKDDDKATEKAINGMLQDYGYSLNDLLTEKR